MADSQVDHRLTQLEIGLAHQQRLCEQLNEVAVGQMRQLLQLERVIGELKKQLHELRDFGKQERSEPKDEKPPHY